MVDIKTLEMLAEKIDSDCRKGYAIQPGAGRSIAEIIRTAIGAPLMWPSRAAGCDAADEAYPGSPDLRHAFNWGVKWAVERYGSTVEIKPR